MCSALTVWANLSAVVFGASIAATAALGRTRIPIPCREVIERSAALVEVIPAVLEDACLGLYR